MIDLLEQEDGLIIRLFVLPRSSKNMIVGEHDGALKIKLTAPPVDGSANKLCVKFLSKQLNISKSRLEIISGHTNRNKRLKVYFEDYKNKIVEKENLEKRLNEIFI